MGEICDERQAEIDRKIDKWRSSKEYRRLGGAVRERIENGIHKRRHSKTVRFLELMIERKEQRWPKEGARIPFYEQAFLDYKNK